MKEGARSFADRLRWVAALSDELRKRGIEPTPKQTRYGQELCLTFLFRRQVS